MNVYVLIRHESYEGSTMYGVYSSRELAEKAQVTYSDADIEEWELDANKELLEAGGRLFLVRWLPNISCKVERASWGEGDPPSFDSFGMLMVHAWAVDAQDAALKTRHHAEKVSEEGLWPLSLDAVKARIAHKKVLDSIAKFDILDTIAYIQEPK